MIARVIACLAFTSILTTLVPCAKGWSNGGYSANPLDPDYGTHDWIADMALEKQTHDVTFLLATYHVGYLLGTEAPDNSEYIGDTTNHHVYYYSDGTIQEDNSAVRASQLYETALQHLIEGEYQHAAYDIGAMTHYIADVGVFGHTMGAYTDWGSEIHHSDYEDAFESMLFSLPAPTDIILYDKPAYDATLDLAEDVTFGRGDIKPNVWMDDNYDWYDPLFEASAVASLHASVEAVAAVINHLLTEAEALGLIPIPETPSAPLALRAEVVGENITLSWAPPEDDGGASISAYKIYRNTQGSSPMLISVVPGSVLSWTDEVAQKGVRYYYAVSAVNSAGEGDMSEIVSSIIPSESSLTALLLSAAAMLSAAATVAGAIIWRRRNKKGHTG